jgi:hypothetical protein
MTRRTLILAAAVLIAGSIARANEPPPAPTPTHHPVVVEWAPGCCPDGCAVKRRPLVEWLTYRPLNRAALCGCCKEPAPVRWPLYTWFLDYCGHGCGGCGYGPIYAAPVAPYYHAPR